jgi:ATP-dependent DNA ligase
MPSAFGIPDTLDFGNLEALAPGRLMDFVLQTHHAQRAGKHLDLRFGDEDTGLYSWAVRKGLPEPGKKHLAIRQPLHEYSYKNFSGEIREGYGKGTVETELGKILIDKIDKDKIVFSRADKKSIERYALIRVPKYGDKKWLLVNITPTEPHGIEKPRYKQINPSEAKKIIQNLMPNSTVQAKLDGARSLIYLTDDIEVYSQRTSVDNKPILYTEKIFEKIPEVKDMPDSLKGSILVGETIALKDGRAIPVSKLSGLLNSTLERAIKTKKDNDIKLVVYLFDIIKQKGINPKELLPTDKIKSLRQIKSQLPKELQDYFEVIESVDTPEAGLNLFEKIKNKQHPLTEEGVVINLPNKPPIKAKFFKEYNVYIRAIFPGTGKYKNKAAGGFYYSFTPDGPIVGKVGTGFDDAARKDMWMNPEYYIGRQARVQALETDENQIQSNIPLRAPSFLALYD